MPASGVVQELDPGEYGQPCFSFVFPETPIDQFAFLRSKKTLSYCVIIGITYTTHGWTHAHFPALFADFNAGVLGGSIGCRNTSDYGGVYETTSRMDAKVDEERVDALARYTVTSQRD